MYFGNSKLEVLCYRSSKQQRQSSDCMDAQADLSILCWHMFKAGFLTLRLIYQTCTVVEVNIDLRAETAYCLSEKLQQ